ncbi:MAG: S41 family peptidase [Oscillospiraceae bacterium]|nr:S41 family peptidase [Oscillospiraceae bacterium]
MMYLLKIQGKSVDNMKNEKRVPVHTVVALVSAAVMITFSLTYFFMSRSYYKKYKTYELMSEIETLIDTYYYEEPEDMEKLVNMALTGYVSGLGDIYSCYNNIEESEEASTNHAGLYVGIGITVTKSAEGYIEIIEIPENSPSLEAGLLVGDIITAIDGKDVLTVGYEESVQSVKGDENTQVTITVKRDGIFTDHKVVRKTFDIVTVHGEMLEEDIGYISISQFNGKTYEQFQAKLDELLGLGAKGFVFDVRNNGGGLVYSVEDCLDPLLPKGEIAVAIYRNGESTTIVESDNNELDIPMTVLINGGSASGAELFAASLRDFRDAKLVGTTSYGKGVMQDTFTLSDKSTLVLTVAKYKTTRTDCYHKIGLVPDVECITDGSSVEDEQLNKALEILKSEIVK